MSNIDFSQPCPNPGFVFPQVSQNADILPAINIPAVNAPGTVTMSILNIDYESGGIVFSHCAGPCPSPQTLFGVTLTVSGSSVTISGNPTGAGVTIIFTLRATSNSVNCDRTFQLPVVRQPLDFEIILDRSGSMAWGYDGNFSPPAGERRWDGLLTGVGVLGAQLALEAEGGDMLGMRMFASSVVVPAAPFNGGLIGMQANAAQLQPTLGGVAPSGNTALGDGTLAGRDTVLPGTTGNHKAMIVFSDGVQNVGDQVRTTPPNQFTHTNSNQKLSGPANEIKIYTICLGSSGHNPSLMQGIADNNDGEYLNTLTGAEADFTTFFTTHLLNILSGSSPQYVDIRKSAFPPLGTETQPVAEESFLVNKGVSSVFVTLLAPNRFEPHFQSFQKDGKEMIEFAQQTRGPGFVTIGLRYPLRRQRDVTLDGKWLVRIGLGTRPTVEVPYTLLIVVDDHIVQPSYSIGARQLKVNQALPLAVTLKRAEKPIENATVVAIVRRPGSDVNDELAVAKVEFGQDPQDPGSPDVAKLAVLLQDPEFRDLIRARDQLVDMTYDPNQGAYTGTFNGLNVTGVYEVIYRIKVDDPEVGPIRRFHHQNFYVLFPDVDLDSSQVSVGQNQAGQTVITFRPRASNGRFIGPGWGGAISLNSNNASIRNVIDKGDGSYDIVVSGALKGPGSLSISDTPVFEGNLEDLGRPRAGFDLIRRIQQWLMSLGLPPWLVWIILILVLIIIILLVSYFQDRNRRD